MQVNIKNVEILKKTYLQNRQIVESLHKIILNYQKELNSLEESAKKELNLSENFLKAAQIYEKQKLAFLLKAEAELARALESEAAAMASGKPTAIASASAWVAKATKEVYQAKKEYEKAKKNRINMEKRVKLAKQAFHKAKQLKEESNRIFNVSFKEVDYKKEVLNNRLLQAYKHLDEYFSNENYLSNLEIIKPNDLKEILKFDDKKAKEYFNYIYVNDEKFRAQVDKLKKEYKEAKTYLEKEKILRKIRQTLAGNFVEKYVEKSLSGLGDIKTQHREEVDNSYSKIDIRIENIKKPLVLGRGECGKYVKKGGTLSIEIKAGTKDYLRSQKEHLVFQTKAHKNSSDASLILTTKDIYDLKNEEEFRKIFKDDCVSIMAMLPRKEEIDQLLINSMELKND